MKKRIEFNKIYVLQSLPENEPMTGKILYDDLLSRKVMQMPGFHAELINFNSLENFAQIMDSITVSCISTAMKPYLHFEAHDNKQGLVLSNLQLLSWETLYEQFVRVNEIIKNQLFVSFASCFGAYIFQIINPLRRSPLFAFIGPPNIAFISDIEADFYEYFNVLLDTKDFNLALDALNSNNDNERANYVFNSSEIIFDQVAGDMLNLYQTRPARRNKVEEMVKRAWKDPVNRSAYSKEYLRSHFAKMLDDRPKHLQNMKDYFLFNRSTADFLDKVI